MLQVHLRKDDIRTARAVDVLLSPLPEGAARLQLELFGLSANNATYASGGDGAYGWWDFFPAPEGWGRPPCWGIAKVSESRASGVAVGTRYYGYFPIGEALDVLPVNVTERGFADGSAHRASKASIYNQYHLAATDPLYDREYEAEQVLFRPTFVPGWWLADFIHHLNPRTVVMSSASSKSAIATAYCLRRLDNYNLVALTSAKNASFTAETALYDRVVDYDHVATLRSDVTATFVDYLGRESLTATVHDALGESLKHSVMFGATDWSDKPGGVQIPHARLKGPMPEVFFTSSHRDKRLSEDPTLSSGVQRDTRAFYPASHKFVSIRRIIGASDIISCWNRLLAGDISPGDGPVLQF
jgi:Protein of unknown function (DUF2855)